MLHHIYMEAHISYLIAMDSDQVFQTLPYFLVN
jgi:hypothetical protein